VSTPVYPKITLSPSRRKPLQHEAELFKTPVDFGFGRQQSSLGDAHTSPVG
jgi:hypothetical protein